MRYAVMVLALTLGLALAQDYSGTYKGQAASGEVVLELLQQGDELEGVLSGPGLRFDLEGFIYAGQGAAGAAYTAEGMIAFEAYLQGDTLGLYLFELDANNEPIVESATELILTRQAAAASQSGAQAANPLAQPGSSTNPLASSDPLVGRFSDGNLTVQIEGDSGQYSGELQFGGQTYPFTAQGTGQALSGSFSSDGQAYVFSATMQGEALTFTTGGTSYTLTRHAASTAQPANPLVAGAADQVIVEGAYASLTEDNAEAFIEALEFSLEQVGYAYRFTDAEKQQLLEAIIQEFPRAQQADQVVLSQARENWTRVQANWSAASEAEKREFVLGVFVLAFGEETVQQWAGSSGPGGQGQALGSGNCTTFEDCTSQFVDQGTWSDTYNAQGCWAAAGCESYDSSTGSFTYSDDY